MVAERLFAPETREEGLAPPPLGRSRAAILDMLHGADDPLDAREVARLTGLHPNTARFHLEALVEAGLAARETEDREAPGRPRIGYRAAADGPGGRRQYRLLSVMLASLIAGTMPEPAAAAEAAGREWGAYLTEKPPPYQRLSAEEAVAKLTGIMGELGFEPQAVTDAGADGQYQLQLRQCPFLEVARQHRDVICALHLGLMRGAFDLMRAPVTADSLQPFAEPGLCVARLTAHDGEPSSREEATMDSEHPMRDEPVADLADEAGGDPVCWAHLVCLECGAVTTEGHRPGCTSAEDDQARRYQSAD